MNIAVNQGLPHIVQWILSFGANHEYFVYVMIVFLACAEGPWLSLILGVLIRLGDFGFFPVYISLMLGDLIGDAVWYYIGQRYGDRFVAKYGKYFKVTAGGVERMTRLYHHYKHSVLFLSKISNGFGFALVTLMTAGMVRIPFGRYMLVNLLGQVVWTGLLLGTGYFFTHLYLTVNTVLGRVSLVAATVVLATVGYRFWKYMRGRFEQLGH
jgi:membrane-associated protein